MKELLSKIDWKKVKISAIKIFFMAILNTPLWVFLIGQFVPYGTIGEFRLSWIDYLKLSDKVEWYHIWILYFFVGLGILLSFLFIKWWITAAKQEKDKQELLKANKDNTDSIIKALQDKYDKEARKRERDRDKYL